MPALSVPDPDSSEVVVSRALWGLEDARRRTYAAIGGIAAAAVDWAPPEGGHTIGSLLYHVAATEMEWVCLDVLGRSEFPSEVRSWLAAGVRDTEDRLVMPSGESLTGHKERLHATRAYTLARIGDMSIAEFRRPRTMALEQRSVTPEWVVHHLGQHEAEHRGQIVRLRRRAEAAFAAANRGSHP
jgi:uncharacterized damage-inducible protein DinB